MFFYKELIKELHFFHSEPAALLERSLFLSRTHTACSILRLFVLNSIIL